MALDYTFYLKTKVPPESLRGRIAAITGLLPTEYKTLQDPASRLIIGVRAGDEEDQKWTQDIYGFKARTMVWFRHGKRDFEHDNRTMMHVVSELLKEYTGGMARRFDENPSTILVRDGNELVIDPAWKDEPEMELLMQGDFKYRIEKLPEL